MKKRYLIVGGSRGTGLALVHKLLEAGHECAVWSRTRDELPESALVQHVVFDALNPDSMPEINGALDGVVYCPGSINLKPFHRLSTLDFLGDFGINVLGAVRVLQHCLPHLKQVQGSSIVLFSTVAVQTGMTFHSSIAAAKGAVEGLTRSLAAELAPGIRVNCIAPSLTDTTLAEKLLNTPEKREAGANRHPLKRIGSAEELAGLAAFLLSEQAAWMTGQILHLDGGMSTLK